MEIAILSEDMTPDENKSLQDYISNGCPGLTQVDDSKAFAWFELYMNNKSYSEIAYITKSKKDLIMYLSYKTKWNNRRMEYYADISQGLAIKLKNAKLQSADTVLNIITALGKFYNETANKYLATNDKSIIENMDTKNLAQYYKSLEVLEKLINPSGNPDNDKPMVNINMGNSGATVTQVDSKTVDITPNTLVDDEAAANLLKSLARYQRSKESQK